MRIKRKYLPILIGNLQRAYLDGVVCNSIDPDLDTQEDTDEDIDTSVGASKAPDENTTRRLH